MLVSPHENMSYEELQSELEQAWLYQQFDFYYSLGHILVVFWLPACIMLLSYAVILCRLHILSRSNLIGRSVNKQKSTRSRQKSTGSRVAKGEVSMAEASSLIGDPQVARTSRAHSMGDSVCVQIEQLQSSISSDHAEEGSPRMTSTKLNQQMVQTGNFLAVPSLNSGNVSNEQEHRRSSTKASCSFTVAEVESKQQVHLTLEGKPKKSLSATNVNLERDAANELGLIVPDPEPMEHSSPLQCPKHGFTEVTLGRAKNKTLRKAIFILLAYITCWGPYNIMALWNLIHMEGLQGALGTNIDFLYNLIVFNAILNPLIYGISL